ncbi:glycosyltransferase [Brevundimonas subvibrioides]|uniref:Glycosyl transferase group 1 n=1 Tax=Brevundimonas subvibrioides (strain ATCC 15264 / DSM 4735 / LMG 14903 / NBRC 16000 / CB 81) TaxID=633149 RepID=D9QP34_BRESC|nr:glycosyltransferase [Brevundimonas subvibrioides]ADL00467.1 glycosyl transferase group 1 [Brevundimonas subvibrioides ATCC 15264]
MRPDLAAEAEEVDHSSNPRRVLINYEVARTAHVDRIKASGVECTMLYGRTYADFEGGADVKTFQRSPFGSTIHILANRYDVVEVNEPLFVRALPRIFASILAVVLARLMGRNTRLVTYAIENADVFAIAELKGGSLGWLARSAIALVATVALRSMDKTAFGSDAALANYRRLFKDQAAGKAQRLFSPLNSACRSCALDRDRTGAVFLGALEPRKGIERLMSIWPSVSAATDTSLDIIGGGYLEPSVLRWGSNYENVRIHGQLPQAEVHKILSRAKVLILLSQPDGFWREQIGLPLLEGLAHGCEVVASTDTSIAPWLSDQGHQVLDMRNSDVEIVSAVVEALDRPSRVKIILDSLPNLDGRVAASGWLWS